MNQTSEDSKKITYRHNLAKFISKEHFKMATKSLELGKSHFLRHIVGIFKVNTILQSLTKLVAKKSENLLF